MTEEVFVGIESDAKVFMISVAARMAGMHPQTLRQYDRLGLVQAGRATGGGRRYSARDVALLREVQRLSQEAGVNLAGIKRIIELEQLVAALQHRILNLEQELRNSRQRVLELETTRFSGTDLVPARPAQTALVIWRPRRQPDGT